MKNRISACLSHKSDEWETPAELFLKLNSKYHFTLDLCASDTNKLCDKYFTKETFILDKVLQLNNEIIFCNPPYSKLSSFIEICYNLSEKNNIVMLIPARTDTKAFHNYIYKRKNVEIEFIKGRIKFCFDGVQKSSAPFPSMIVIFKKRK